MFVANRMEIDWVVFSPALSTDIGYRYLRNSILHYTSPVSRSLPGECDCLIVPVRDKVGLSFELVNTLWTSHVRYFSSYLPVPYYILPQNAFFNVVNQNLLPMCVKPLPLISILCILSVLQEKKNPDCLL